MKLAVLSTVALIATSGGASAYGLPEIERVQDRQRQRIEHGRFTGQLTHREYWRLMEEQGEISRLLWRALSDGWISHREYHRIREAQELASSNIRWERQDGQYRPWRVWRSRFGSPSRFGS